MNTIPAEYRRLREAAILVGNDAKVAAARAWLAQREAERGPHRYSSVPCVLLPTQQRRVQREQERQT